MPSVEYARKRLLQSKGLPKMEEDGSAFPLELPPLGEPRPPPKYRSRFPVALKRAAEEVDKAQLRFAENPLKFEDAFEDSKQRFMDVYEAMSEKKQRELQHAALYVNMRDIWGDEARYRAYRSTH